MNSSDDNFKTAFEDALDEHGAIFQNDESDIYSIAQISMPERIITARLIGSEPTDERIHGAKNNTKIKAIGYFKFKLSLEDHEPNFFVFAFRNIPDNKIEFAVIPYTELKKRLKLRTSFTAKDYWTELKFWLMPPENYLFETTNLGAEGEYWFVGGKLFRYMQWEYTDYTEFLNGWNVLNLT